MYGSYFMCVNKNGYNFLGSMSAMCDVKPLRVRLLQNHGLRLRGGHEGYFNGPLP